MRFDEPIILQYESGPKGPYFGRVAGKPVLPARGFQPELGEWFQLRLEERERIIIAYPLAKCERVAVPEGVVWGITPRGWLYNVDYVHDNGWIIVPRRLLPQLEEHLRRAALEAAEARRLWEEHSRRMEEERRALEERAEALVRAGAHRQGRYVYDGSAWSEYQAELEKYRAALPRAEVLLRRKWEILSKPSEWSRKETIDGFVFTAVASTSWYFDDDYGNSNVTQTFHVVGEPPEPPKPILVIMTEEERDADA